MRRLRVSLLILVILCGVVSPLWATSQEVASKQARFTGDPAKKRGVDYGFDKGFEAGKADQAAGLKPDPKRHDDFNNPDKYYRHEFGSRASFVSGFKAGFVGGYQKAFGKKVRIKLPGDPKTQETTPPKQPDISGDAL